MAWFERIRMKSKIKWAALGGLVLSFASIMVHLFLAKSSATLVQYGAVTAFTEDLNHIGNPSSKICDLVTVARLLNATLVIPEIQESTQSKGISSKFKSFSYLYDEEHFITALASDVIIVRNLPSNLKEGRKRKQYPIFRPKSSSSPKYYLHEVLPKLKNAKVIGLILADGGCLQSILPSSLIEYQRIRCRVAFHALHFRAEIIEVAHQMVERQVLRGSGQPYLAYHPGLKRDTLAYHGCAELFQDVHTELIQYRRAQMIKQGIIKEGLSVDSYARKGNGSCPLMPEEVGLLLRAMSYPPRTRIYLAGSETFGGQRVLIPLRAMYANLVDRTSLCSKQELANIIGPENQLPEDSFEFPPTKNPSPNGLRDQAHRLLWDALDYIVSVEADAYFPGFDNDGSGWPDFSSLVMGHRLYKMASSRTYRPDRKYLTELFNSTSDHLYHPPRNWTLTVREHLNKSTAEDGVVREFQQLKPKSFLSHPLPECSCTTVKSADLQKGSKLQILYRGQDECPQELEQSLKTVGSQEINVDDIETQEDETETDLPESDENSEADTVPSVEQDEEMDPND
ncbi:hypothetical protein DH2020_007201 [Rehmannia glutinosa]|uniref:O-fucosyltransferase family protein n=1 Tax=Rehmannia glutinosa TaxID=99300 RepID=A0ABR0TXQ1_REHGL